VPVDYDNDGDQDVWIGYHDQGGKLWSNNGSGAYTRVAAAAWPTVNADGQIPDRHYCAWADVDRNGLKDAYCSAGRGGANAVKHGKDNELWLQTAKGRFKEVGTAWGIGELCGRSHYVAFLNANGDAYPDLFVGNEPPRAATGDPCDNPANGLPNEKASCSSTEPARASLMRGSVSPGSAEVDAPRWSTSTETGGTTSSFVGIPALASTGAERVPASRT
jgi:hypothetical protein